MTKPLSELSLLPNPIPASVLEVEDLEVSFKFGDQWVPVVKSASIKLLPGRVVGLVGESGSGKTVTSLSAIGLARYLGGRITGGSVRLQGRDVTNLSEAHWSDLRGREIGMVFQQPFRSLNPSFTIGTQITQIVRRHERVSKRDARQKAVEMLDRVHIANAAKRLDDYPHQFSGGMAQRVAIAMALVCEPKILIADEPTTALDVTVQARVVELLRELQADLGLSILFITHDLGVVAQICDEVCVMYAGELVERAPVTDIFTRPTHPYTEGLIASIAQPGKQSRLRAISGVVPAPNRMPSGCRFHPRCGYAVPGVCTDTPPELLDVEAGVSTRCHRVDEIVLKGID